MTEIAQLFESALRQNRVSLLRQAAKTTIAKMPASTTLQELLAGDAADAVRSLTMSEFGVLLKEAGYEGRTRASGGRRRVVDDGRNEACTASGWSSPDGSPSDGAGAGGSSSDSGTWEAEGDDAQRFRRILDAIEDEPLTIGQLAREVDIEIDELRGYLAWMKEAGKVITTGRARGTRYQAVRGRR